MPFANSSSAVVTRAIVLLSAVGIKVSPMQSSKRINRDENEVMIAELASRKKRREGDTLIVNGNHEDHGRTELRRAAGVFTITAKDLSFVRDAFAPMEVAD